MIITSRGHFWIEFDNGYRVSVFNDWGSYSDNHFNEELEKSFMNDENRRIMSSNCEVAVIHGSEFVKMPGWDDSVKGNVTSNELLQIMEEVSKL